MKLNKIAKQISGCIDSVGFIPISKNIRIQATPFENKQKIILTIIDLELSENIDLEFDMFMDSGVQIFPMIDYSLTLDFICDQFINYVDKRWLIKFPYDERLEKLKEMENFFKGVFSGKALLSR